MARSKYEIKAQKELEEARWVVDYKARPFRCPKGYRIDYFGLFDLMAYKGGVIRFIAIKGHQGVPSKLRKGIEAFATKEPWVQKEIWTFREDRTVRKEVIRSDKINKSPLAIGLAREGTFT